MLISGFMVLIDCVGDRITGSAIGIAPSAAAAAAMGLTVSCFDGTGATLLSSLNEASSNVTPSMGLVFDHRILFSSIAAELGVLGLSLLLAAPIVQRRANEPNDSMSSSSAGTRAREGALGRALECQPSHEAPGERGQERPWPRAVQQVANLASQLQKTYLPACCDLVSRCW